MPAFSLAKHRLSLCMVFAKEWLRSPRAMGTFCPSGPNLARAMAAKVKPGNGLVVELGAGTGVVTAELLSQGITPDRLLVIERSASMVALLKKRFPEARIVHGDAASFSHYLNGTPVDSIVSSLPFVSLPRLVREAIINEIRQTLHGGTMVQFTYALGLESCLSRAGFTCISSTTVWRNMPPARVMEFTIRH